MKKFIISIFIILIFAGVVFYFGWVQFDVPTGKCGVLISKTSGIYKEPIIAGKFVWRWERLLPTNTELRLFSLEPTSLTDTITASLPSAAIYSTSLAGNPDFSYSITMTTSAKPRPEYIVSLVEKNDIKKQTELDEFVKNQIRQFNILAIEFILKNAQTQTENLVLQPLSTEELIKGTDAINKFPEIEIISAQASNIKIPDMALYLIAKEIYIKNQNTSQNSINNEIKLEKAESKEITKLEKLGAVLSKHPELATFLKENEPEKVLQILELAE